MKEKCIRCGKETPYDVNTPIEARLYYVEGSGQLCPECWRKQYLTVDYSRSDIDWKPNHGMGKVLYPLL